LIRTAASMLMPGMATSHHSSSACSGRAPSSAGGLRDDRDVGVLLQRRATLGY
jgi:hypothetical protein